METGEYHWRDGVYFKRMDEDGTVRLRVEWAGDSGDMVSRVIPANEWASIVAHVAAGDDGVAFARAQAVHAGNHPATLRQIRGGIPSMDDGEEAPSAALPAPNGDQK